MRSGDEIGWWWWGGGLAKGYLTLRTRIYAHALRTLGGMTRVGDGARALDNERALAVPMQSWRRKDWLCLALSYMR